tara:strand:- start:133 stop:816 length:684 start_codon:yes stop_codon:yes gene_type:complete
MEEEYSEGDLVDSLANSPDLVYDNQGGDFTFQQPGRFDFGVTYEDVAGGLHDTFKSATEPRCHQIHQGGTAVMWFNNLTEKGNSGGGSTFWGNGQYWRIDAIDWSVGGTKGIMFTLITAASGGYPGRTYQINGNSSNTWNMIAVYYDPATGRSGLRVNDTVDEAVVAADINQADSGTNKLFLSTGFGGGGIYTKSITTFDEMYLWNRVLATGELDWLYNDGAGRQPI